MLTGLEGKTRGRVSALGLVAGQCRRDSPVPLLLFPIQGREACEGGGGSPGEHEEGRQQGAV